MAICSAGVRLYCPLRRLAQEALVEMLRACMMRRLMAAMLPTVTWDHPRAKLVLFSIVVSISFIVASPAGIAPGTVTVQAAPAGGMLTIFAHQTKKYSHIMSKLNSRDIASYGGNYEYITRIAFDSSDHHDPRIHCSNFGNLAEAEGTPAFSGRLLSVKDNLLDAIAALARKRALRADLLESARISLLGAATAEDIGHVIDLLSDALRARGLKCR